MLRTQSKLMTIMFLLAVLLFPQSVHSETIVEAQTIDSDVTWTLEGSPYKVTGNVTVAQTGGVRIEPGVVLEMGADVSLTVNGAFEAEGTSSEPITFKWATEGVHWGDLYFTSSSLPRNSLSHCRITGGTEVDIRSDMTVANSVVERNSGNGIYVTSSPTIRNSTVTQNATDGIHIYSGSPLVENCLITDNGEHGIDIHSTSSLATIRFNTIDSNGGAGIRLYYSDTSGTAENNIVINNLRGFYRGGGVQRGYNNVWGNATDYSSVTAADTDISVDPLYVDEWNDNFHLQEDSPCKTTSKDKTEIGAYAGVDGEIGIYGIGQDDPLPVEVTLTSPNTSTIFYYLATQCPEPGRPPMLIPLTT